MSFGASIGAGTKGCGGYDLTAAIAIEGECGNDLLLPWVQLRQQDSRTGLLAALRRRIENGYFLNIGELLPAAHADAALNVLKKVEVSAGTVRMGRVEETPGRAVVLLSRIGGHRGVDMLSGEQLPRIC